MQIRILPLFFCFSVVAMHEKRPNVSRRLEPKICGICREAVSTTKVVTPCNHEFCLSCFVPWVQRKKTCPLCRHDVTFDELDDPSAESEDDWCMVATKLLVILWFLGSLVYQVGS